MAISCVTNGDFFFSFFASIFCFLLLFKFVFLVLLLGFKLLGSFNCYVNCITDTSDGRRVCCLTRRDTTPMHVITFNFVIFSNYYRYRVWCLSRCFISASILVIGLILNVIEVNCELGEGF
jgi:hypothetical protein